MFTGIVTHIGTVAAVDEIPGGRELVVASSLPLAEIPLGASVAHSGICLTVTAKAPGQHKVKVSAETLARTTLRRWVAGTRVNLERSLKLGDELGGHLVFGHVDAVGTILDVRPEGDYRRVEIALPDDLAALVAVKGSIAVDGISLTVNAVEAARFAVTVIPHTLHHTTLAERRAGDAVNLEADMLARYVARQLTVMRGEAC